MTTPGPCPVCREPGGFHNPAAHAGRQVPTGLTWKAGEKPPWERDEPVAPAHVQEDATAILSVLKGLSEEDL